MKPHKTWFVVGAITAVALALRLHHLTANPFWIDEGWTLYLANLPWLQVPFYDVHPPLYAWLVKLSISVLGVSEFAVRLPSVIAGTLAIPFLYIFAREYSGSDVAGIITSGLLAVSSFHIWHSQDARSYTIWFLVLLVFLTLFLWAYRKKTAIYLWIFAGLVAGIGMWLHYFTAIMVGILALYVFLTQRETIKDALPGLLAFLAVSIPLVPIFIRCYSIKMNEGWTILVPWDQMAGQIWIDFAGGDTGLASFLIVFSILGVYALWQDGRGKEAGIGIFLITVSTVVMVALSIWFMAFPKYVMFLLPFVYTLTALGLTLIAHPTLQVSYGSILAMLLIGAVFVLAMGPLEVHYAQENRDGWFDHNVALSEITHGENISILATPGLFTQWDYYYSGTASLFTSEKALQEQICSNGRDTYVFVPASTIPSASMLEANNIQHFLNKYGELVAESYRGFNGYRVEKGMFCTDTLAFSDAAMEAWA